MVTSTDDQDARVLQRIERLLAGLERARRQPNRREAYYLCAAIEHLQAGRYPDADEATLKAERLVPVPPSVAAQLELNQPPTLTELRTAIRQFAQAQSGR
jgi:hypothetical protein